MLSLADIITFKTSSLQKVNNCKLPSGWSSYLLCSLLRGFGQAKSGYGNSILKTFKFFWVNILKAAKIWAGKSEQKIIDPNSWKQLYVPDASKKLLALQKK